MTASARPFIIGTAGHVDHGKTTLVRFLTGVNTDRLREEQARGITIELGFAPFTLRQGDEEISAGLVDVPGHERFVRHMVSGAGGMDLVMMVVAADEGVMPQTREHLAICRFLGVKAGVIVLTKVDLVEEDWLELVEEDVREGLAGSFLEDAAMVHFTAHPSDPDSQRRVLEEAVAVARGGLESTDSDSLFRLPVDRVFSMRGHGTVITGTVVGGEVALGEEVELQPGGRVTRVRNLQSFGASQERVTAGMRAAINLAGLETSDVSRGMVLVRRGTVRPTDTIDAVVDVLPHAPKMLDNGSAVIFHSGATHTNATLRVFEAPILPGERGIARLHLQDPVVVLPGDRFILRGYADVPGHGKTVGGGEILLLSGGPYRLRYKGARLRDFLAALARAEGPERLGLVLCAAGHGGLATGDLAARLGQGIERTARMLSAAEEARKVLIVEESPPLYLESEVVAALAARIVSMVRQEIESNPLADGLSREVIRSGIRPAIRPRVLQTVLESMEASGVVTLARDMVSLPGHEVRLEGVYAAMAERIEALVRESGLAPPWVDQLAEQLGAVSSEARAVMALLARRGRLVRVADGLYYEPDALKALQADLVAHLGANGEISTQQFKQMTGLSRRHAIPLAEYFDAVKVTVRKGEGRVLRR